MTWNFFPALELQKHQEAWQSTNSRGANTALLHPDFLLPMLPIFGTGKEILAIHGDSKQPTAMALLTPGKWGVWQTFQASQAPLGAWVSDPSLPMEPLLAGLIAALPGLSLMIGVTQQDPDLNPRPVTSPRLQTLDYIQTARISVNGSFDNDYWAKRGRNLRHNLKRQRNGLIKSGITPRLEVITTPTDVHAAVERYGKLESAGWKTSTGTAIHAANAQGRYYNEMLERFAHRDETRIYHYWYNDQLVAIDLCIQHNGTLIILKTTYDESQTTSPAFLMRLDYFKQIFDEGAIKRIEFYGKLMEWHTKWSEEIRTLYHVNFYRSALLGQLHRAAKSNSKETTK